MKKELTTPAVFAIVLLFCLAYLGQLRLWVWLCGVTGWQRDSFWIFMGAALVSAKYTTWTMNTLQEWMDERRAKGGKV